MRHAKKIKKAAEDEVVVEQAVPKVLAANKSLEGYLQLGKHLLKKGDDGVLYVRPIALYSAEAATNSEKFFLRRKNSLANYYPPPKKLLKWVSDICNEQPRIVNEHTGCIITLAQPRCSRPVRTYPVPAQDGRPATVCGLTFGALVLRANNILPRRGNDEASHVCGYARCVNHAHLCWESASENVERNDCHHYGAVCRHVPRCVTPYDYEFAELIKQQLQQARLKGQ